MRHLRSIGTCAVLAFSIGVCLGGGIPDLSLTPTGLASMEAGQVVRGYDKNAGDISDVAVTRIILGAGFNAAFSERTRFTGSIEVKTFNEFPRLVTLGATRRFYYYLYLTQAELTRHIDGLLHIDGLSADVGGGYFPFKYNSNVRNLGEYLFRSTAYPQTLTTEFDYPFARLAGFYAKGAYGAGMHQLNLDLLATTNTEWVAIGDVNLSAVASYTIARIVEIGAGVQFSSLVSVDESATTPENVNTRYIEGTDTSDYYTFRGVKGMVRFSLDPKKILPGGLFGDRDLIVYGEAALLGIKNYDMALHSPIWYNSIRERVPMMLGFNVPVFKLLDVLSLEGEWWGNRYPNSMEGIVNDGLPLPFRSGTQSIDSTKYKNDNLKWSIYGARSFAKHYRLSFQIASDHMRTFAWDWVRQDWEESLRGPDKWYYLLKFGIYF